MKNIKIFVSRCSSFILTASFQSPLLKGASIPLNISVNTGKELCELYKEAKRKSVLTGITNSVRTPILVPVAGLEPARALPVAF
jgi:hypothetical protein